MIRSLATTLLAIALLCGTPARAAQWLYYSEPDFELYGDAGSRHVTEAVRNMQVYRLARDKVVPKLKSSDAVRPRVFVLSGASFAQYANARRGIAGFVRSHDFGIDIVIDGSVKDWTGTSSVVQHELTHYYLHQSADFALPAWFDEGLAEYLSTIDVQRGKLRLGIPAGDRWVHVREMSWMPLREVLGATRNSATYTSHEAAPAFYAQSWALTHYILTVRGEDARKVSQMLAYQDNGANIDTAIKDVFGADFPAFEDRVRKYARSSKLTYGEIDVPPLPDVREQILPIDETRGLTELLLFAVRGRRTGDPEVRKLADRLAADPANGRAAAAAALIARSDGDWNAGTEALGRCSGPAADDVTLVLCGDAWMAPAWRGRADPAGNDDRTRAASLQATTLYERAWKANPANFEAINSVVMAHAVHRQRTPEIKAELRAAVDRYPRSTTLRFQYGRMQMASGELDEARRTLERVLMDSKNPELRLRLIRTLREVENDIAERNNSP